MLKTRLGARASRSDISVHHKLIFQSFAIFLYVGKFIKLHNVHLATAGVRLSIKLLSLILIYT